MPQIHCLTPLPCPAYGYPDLAGEGELKIELSVVCAVSTMALPKLDF